MSEVLEYNRDVFPIAGILEDLTGRVVQAEMQPVEAYGVFAHEMSRQGLNRVLDYTSTSITTGGHARIPGANMDTIIAGNTRTARLLCAHLVQAAQMESKEAVVPVDLGNTGWSQQGFMSFWALTIGGPNLRNIAKSPQGLSRLEKQLATRVKEREVDVDAMRDASVEPIWRRPHYHNYIRACADVIKAQRAGFTPVHRFISLVDTVISLGCDAENVLAAELGIPRFRLTAMKPTSLVEASRSIPVLGEDLKIISLHRGEIVVAEKGSRLVLARAKPAV